MSDGMRTIKMTGSSNVAIKDSVMEITPNNDGGCVVVVQTTIGLVLYIYHPLAGWYMQSGSGDNNGGQANEEGS